MKYNVDNRESVDTKTGETGKLVYERFLFLRTIDDFDWMIGLSITEVRTLLFFVMEANKDGFLEFTPRVRRRVLKKIGIKDRMFYNVMRTLKTRELIKEIEPNYYRVAPFTAFKFNSRSMSANIREYLSI